MLRTPNIEDKKMMQLINKELMNGFEDFFEIRSDNSDLITDMVKQFCEGNQIVLKSNLDLDLYKFKILGMYHELADQNNLYTFDEHGEWILSRLLLMSLHTFESFLGNPQAFDDKYDHDDEPSIDDFWETSLSEEDIEYVESWADPYFSGLIRTIADEEGIDTPDAMNGLELEFDMKKQLFIQRVCFFPLMAMELIEDMTPEFLFWDRDFMLIDEFGPERFEEVKKHISESGFDIGFSKVTDKTELYTGSLKIEL